MQYRLVKHIEFSYMKGKEVYVYIIQREVGNNWITDEEFYVPTIYTWLHLADIYAKRWYKNYVKHETTVHTEEVIC